MIVQKIRFSAAANGGRGAGLEDWPDFTPPRQLKGSAQRWRKVPLEQQQADGMPGAHCLLPAAMLAAML